MPKYPLKPLLEHRERLVTDAKDELAQAARAREAAEDARREAEAQRLRAADEAARQRDDEAERLARGELRAIDLARAEAWEVGVRAEMDDLDRAVSARARRTEEMAAKEQAALGTLVRRTSERDVVAKDEQRFDAQVRRRTAASEEEALGDLIASRRRG
jgi:hypothetical protein